MSLLNVFRGYNPFQHAGNNNRKLTKSRKNQKGRNNYKGSQHEANHVYIEKRCIEADRCVGIFQDRVNAKDSLEESKAKLDMWKMELEAWLEVAEENLPFRRLKELNKELLYA